MLMGRFSFVLIKKKDTSDSSYIYIYIYPTYFKQNVDPIPFSAEHTDKVFFNSNQISQMAIKMQIFIYVSILCTSHQK